MSGTVIGGRAARDTNYKRQGKDFYRTIGRAGGSRRVPKGFSFNRELAMRVGAIGGSVSRRNKA